MGYEGKQGKDTAPENKPVEIHKREVTADQIREALSQSRLALHQEIDEDKKKGGTGEALFSAGYDRKSPTPLQEKAMRDYFRSASGIAEVMLQSVQDANKMIDELHAVEPRFGFWTRTVEAPTFEVQEKGLVPPALYGRQVEVPLLLDGPVKKQTKKEIDVAISAAYDVLRQVSNNQIFMERGRNGNVGNEINAVLYSSESKFSSSVAQDAQRLQQLLRNLQEAVKVKLGKDVRGDRSDVRLESDDI